MPDSPMYVNLHTHSDYSLLDGLAKVDQLIARAKELGMPALGLTDHGVLYGAVDFYKGCHKAEIKPIIGVEAYLASRTRFDKVPKVDSKYYHLTLLARTNQGYANLIELVTAGWMEGFYYKPRIDQELLAEKADGLIILTGCLNGEVSQAIFNGKPDEAVRLIKWYQELVGPEHVFLEIQDHPNLPEQQTVTKALIELARTHHWPLVATCDSHYSVLTDKDAHEILLAVQSKSMDEDKRWSLAAVDLHLRTPQEMATAFAEVPEALTNTFRIAELCDVTMTFGENKLPEFPSTRGLSNIDELRQLCDAGLVTRYGDQVTAEHRERLNYELGVIERMGFPSYFLIVADYVTWAKEHGILVGPGRGSAAGSIVAYLTGITELDPVAYGLLFERFLNPDRISMPDIDTDFADTDRAKVLAYVREKYGDDHVAGIITFGTMAARASVRDTGRALGMSYQEVDRIAKLIPPPKQGKHIPIPKLIQEIPELKAVYVAEPAAKQLLNLAARLEGTYRHAGQHASAIVISKDPLTRTVPLQPAQKGDVAHVTQFSMYPVDELGLLKMDFLGLSNLSIIQRAIEIIEAVRGTKVSISDLPLADQPTYDLFTRGDTTGVFQFESAGMKRYLRELKPNVLDDIIAMVALYRPGPLGSGLVDSFIRRKHGQEQVTYLHPLTEDALRATYGVPIFQEQVMQVAKDMAGFTSGEADTLRKAMGKKIAKLMAELRDKFVDGSVMRGVPKETASQIFTQFEDFAAYGFNKSHAACYALIAYQTAYLKAHYPSEFMAALMTADHGDTDRLAIEIDECRRMGIEVLPPDVNESFVDFGVVKETGTIRYGLAGIKNIGSGVAQAVVKERKTQGAYRSLLDFVERLGPEVINKKALESLAKAGALDAFAERNQLLTGLDQILKVATVRKREADSRQIGLFDVGGPVQSVEATLELPVVEAASGRQRLSWEKELLGMFLSDHPLREHADLMRAHATAIAELSEEMVGQRVRLAGVIISMKKIVTKAKQPMAFGILEDLTKTIEFLFFPKTLEEYGAQLAADALILLEGRISTRDNELKLVVEKVWPLGEQLNLEDLPALIQDRSRRTDRPAAAGSAAAQPPPSTKPRGPISSKLVVTLPSDTSKDVLHAMKKLFANYPGNSPVILRVAQDGTWTELPTKTRVDLATSLEHDLGMLIGKQHVTIRLMEDQ
ncbi:DNA polymerase III subunit alpha [Candidatus Berkelbacteria bacterium]|nr:DNA polymerase III subunit alpha [Candidatus Berkelbacteria bacterium]